MDDFHRKYIEQRLPEATDADAEADRTNRPARIGVIGGGVAGLTTGHHLTRRGVAADIFEANAQPGGCLRSTRSNGYLLERGPHTLMSGNFAFEQLVDDLGLKDARIPTPETARRRYIVKHGRLRALPDSFSSFLDTSLFSTRAKLRLLAEPLQPRGDDHIDESLAQFIERRLGPEILDYAVGPFVGGIHAADPRLLSSEHALSTLHDFEEEWGSIMLGGISTLIDKLLEGGPSPSGDLIGFEGGNQTLAHRLADRLDDRLHLNTPIRRIVFDADRWFLQSDAGERFGPYDDIVMTAPAHAWPDFEFNDATLGAKLTDIADEIDYPPVTVVSIGLDRDEVHHPLDGFGMLVPDSEAYRMLGTLFISTLFPDRAPDGKVLLSSFVGGSRDRSLAKMRDDQLVDMVDSDLAELLGLKEVPDFHDIYRWPRAIPQYEVGYGRLLDSMKDLERTYPGLHLVGNFRQGLGVPDVIENATELARDLSRLHANRSRTELPALSI